MLTSLLLKKVEFYNIGDFAGRRPQITARFSQREFFTRSKNANMWVHAHTLKNRTTFVDGKQAGTRTRLTDFLGWQTGGYTGYTAASDIVPMANRRVHLAFGRGGPGRALARPVTVTHPPQTFFKIFLLHFSHVQIFATNCQKCSGNRSASSVHLRRGKVRSER